MYKIFQIKTAPQMRMPFFEPNDMLANLVILDFVLQVLQVRL
jgi:hypothetical protein